jgi:hypothetical protein
VTAGTSATTTPGSASSRSCTPRLSTGASGSSAWTTALTAAIAAAPAKCPTDRRFQRTFESSHQWFGSRATRGRLSSSAA